MTEIRGQKSEISKNAARRGLSASRNPLTSRHFSCWPNLTSGLRLLTSVFCAFLFALWFPVEAQQPPKAPRIGYLSVGSPVTTPARYEAFRHGLRELGYVEGKNIVIEYRYSDQNLENLPALAAELARLKVDIIVTGGPTPTRAAKKATSTIPIVMTFDSDPVGNGFVASLGRPGGNITGLSNVAPEVSGKRLELLKEILPKFSRAAVFGMSSNPGNALSLKETQQAARALDVQIHYFDIRDPKSVESAFRAASKQRVDAGLVLNFPPLIRQTIIPELAAKLRLPTIYFNSEFVDAGGLMSYGASLTDLDRRAAMYVDKILKGARPAELPVEQPTKFEMVINLRTAKQLELIMPPNVLARADRVIK